MMACQIILASSSTARRELLNHLGIKYIAIAPDIDETAKPSESAEQLAYRLSFEKAKIISEQYPDSIVIGSDQVAWLEEQPQIFLGKPYTEQNAIKQLREQSGKILNFSTGLSVQCLNHHTHYNAVVHYQVKFRCLSNDEIQRYVQLDQPLNCAGSFKSEKSGMALLEWMKGDDYTALVGLPIIQLCHFLRNLNFKIP